MERQMRADVDDELTRADADSRLMEMAVEAEEQGETDLRDTLLAALTVTDK